MLTRQPAVAGQFYPADPKEIDRMLAQFDQRLSAPPYDTTLSQLISRAVVVPHAGYVYSGLTAHMAFRALANNPHIRTVAVIGPSHRVYLSGVSVADTERYATPLGMLTVNQDWVQRLKDRYGIRFVPDAHHEHSTEVQMPLIAHWFQGVSVVELVYGAEDPAHMAGLIEALLRDPEMGVVISTDLSHYYPIDMANRLDAICIDAVERLDPLRLHDGCEACGVIGLEAMLMVAREAGLHPHIIDYRTSADASGDRTQVVGYMSAVFTA